MSCAAKMLSYVTDSSVNIVRLSPTGVGVILQNVRASFPACYVFKSLLLTC